FSTTFLQERMKTYILDDDRKGIERSVSSGFFIYGLVRAIPVFLMLVFGNTLVEFILEVVPEWLIDGLSVSGGLLPAVGIAILLRYLPVKQQFPYLLI